MIQEELQPTAEHMPAGTFARQWRHFLVPTASVTLKVNGESASRQGRETDQ